MAYGRPGRPRKDGSDKAVAGLPVEPLEPPKPEPKVDTRKTRWIKVGTLHGHQVTDPEDGFPWQITEAQIINPIGAELDAVLAKIDEGDWEVKSSFSTGMHSILLVQKRSAKGAGE